MLPAGARLRSPDDFRRTTRRGVRCGRPTLVIHALTTAHPGATETAEVPLPPRVGFVVSKAVGNAVTRNRVKRRLRHLVRVELVEHPLPDGATVVVRALPAAATATEQLADDLTSAWRQALRKVAA